MEIARAIYKGGEIIRADDKSLNYSSYVNLGLRCPICGEEVYLKKGEQKKPHFAHFHQTEESDECSLRLKANGSSRGWQNIVEGKGQRREIFQQHFLDIIASGNPDFYESVKTAKNKVNNIELEQLIKRCVIDLKENSRKYIDYCYRRELDSYDNSNKNFTLQIIFEAVDYLLTPTSHSDLLQTIIIYFTAKIQIKIFVMKLSNYYQKLIDLNNFQV